MPKYRSPIGKVVSCIRFLLISIAKRCSYNSPTQRSHPNPNPTQSTYSSKAEKGQTEQDQNAGVRLTIQNWDIRNNLFRQNFCRSLRKFRNCIKKRCKTSALNTNQELPQNTTEFNQKIQSSTQKGPMNSAIYRQLLGT